MQPKKAEKGKVITFPVGADGKIENPLAADIPKAAGISATALKSMIRDSVSRAEFAAYCKQNGVDPDDPRVQAKAKADLDEMFSQTRVERSSIEAITAAKHIAKYGTDPVDVTAVAIADVFTRVAKEIRDPKTRVADRGRLLALLRSQHGLGDELISAILTLVTAFGKRDSALFPKLATRCKAKFPELFDHVRWFVLEHAEECVRQGAEFRAPDAQDYLRTKNIQADESTVRKIVAALGYRRRSRGRPKIGT